MLFLSKLRNKSTIVLKKVVNLRRFWGYNAFLYKKVLLIHFSVFYRDRIKFFF